MKSYNYSNIYYNNSVRNCNNWILNLNWEKTFGSSLAQMFSNESYSYSPPIALGAKLKQADLINLTNINNLCNAFSGCYLLTSLNTSSWNMSNVENVSYMFCNCSNLITLDTSNWNMSKVKNFTEMFSACYNLTTLDTSNWNMSNVVISMDNTFNSCYNLTTLNTSNWDTSNVIIMKNTFKFCNNLTTLDVSEWKINNVIDISNLFSGCKSLTSLDVSNWNTKNVQNLGGIFYGCRNLTTLDVSNWNTNNVQNMAWTFRDCNNVTTLDVSNWNTNNIVNMSGVFWHCDNLVNLNIFNWNVDNVINMSYVFSFCNHFIDLNLSTWNINNVQNVYQMFGGTGSGNWNCDYSNDHMGTQYFGGVTFNFIPYWNFSNVTDMSFFLNKANCGYIPLYSIHDDSTESWNMININWHTDKVVNINYAFSFNSYLPYCESRSDWASYNTNGPDGQANWFFNFNNVINAQGVFSANSYWVTRVEDSDFSSVDVMGADYLLYLNNTENIINAQNMFAMDKSCNSNFETNDLWYQYAIPTFNIQTSILNLNNASNIAYLFYNYQPIVTNWGNGTWDYDNGKWDWWPTSNSMKKTLPTLILNNVTNLAFAYYNTRTPINTTYWNLSEVTNLAQTFGMCNVLDNASLTNIANALLTATGLTWSRKNLYNTNTTSPFRDCNKYINNATVGTDLVTQLRAAGWYVPE